MKPKYCAGDRFHGSTDETKIVGYKSIEGRTVFAAEAGHTTDRKLAVCHHGLLDRELENLSIHFFWLSKKHCFGSASPHSPFVMIDSRVITFRDPDWNDNLEIGVLGLEEKYSMERWLE